MASPWPGLVRIAVLWLTMMRLGLWLRKLTTGPNKVGGAMVRLIDNSRVMANKANAWSEVSEGCVTMSRVDKDGRAMANNDDAWAVKKSRQRQEKQGHSQG